MNGYSKDEVETKMNELRAVGVKDDEMSILEKDGRYVILLATRRDVSAVSIAPCSA